MEGAGYENVNNRRQMPRAPSQEFITSSEFAAKFQSKREVYRFLASDVKAYLPSIETTTIWHLRDLASGKKRIIKSEKIKHLNVPQFKGLTIPDMLEFADNYPTCKFYLPVDKEVYKLSRQYIANIIYTVVGTPFANWVRDKVDARNTKIKQEQNLLIEMDPDIAAAFRASTSVSGKL